MDKFRKKIAVSVFLLIVFSLLIIINSFTHVRLNLDDSLHQTKPSLDNIIIIKIDDQSIQRLGRWPWDRDQFANLLSNITGARAIGLDVSFLEASSNDNNLLEELEKHPEVVLAAEINNNKLYSPIFNSTYGYVNFITDNDGVTRSLNLNSQGIDHFTIKVYEKAFNIKPAQTRGVYVPKFTGPPNSFVSYSFTQVLDDKIDFNDKIVLIGATAPDLHDTFFVPTSKGQAMPGVEIHANTLQSIILNKGITRSPVYLNLMITLLAILIGFFILSNLKIRYTFLSNISIILAYILLAINLSSVHSYNLDLFFPTLSLIFSTFAGFAVNYFHEKQHSEYLAEAFGRYISKDLLGEIVGRRHELKLGGEKRRITLFFSDIRGFTSISEKLSPEDLVHLVNDYLTEMTEIILEHKGTVDKFIGDAIMSFWNAPLKESEHPLLACQAAKAQIKALKRLQKKWKKQKLPEINIGCGVHTGDAIIGNMGSENRFDYTAMGDNVNLASRLEGLTKEYGVSIIISQETQKEIKGKLQTRLLDAVKVKGKKIPVKIYELCIQEQEKLNKQYEKALELYFKGEFKKAETEFKKALKISPDDLSSQMFIKRCRQYRSSPPQDGWDGSFEMKTK